MSIIVKFLTNQTAAYEIIIAITPYCPTPQHLLHMQEGVNLLNLMTFGESKCPGHLLFFEITLRRITVMWYYAQVSVRWAIDEIKGGYNTSSLISFHYPIFFIPSLTRKGHFLDNIRRILLVK